MASSPAPWFPPLARQTNTALFACFLKHARSLAPTQTQNRRITLSVLSIVAAVFGKSGEIGGRRRGRRWRSKTRTKCCVLSRGISCLSGEEGGGDCDELESSGAGFWLAGEGRAQGSEFLGARRPLAGWWGVSAERCGGWDGLSLCPSAVSALSTLVQAGAGAGAGFLGGRLRREEGSGSEGRRGTPWRNPSGSKNRKRPNLCRLGKAFARAGGHPGLPGRDWTEVDWIEELTGNGRPRPQACTVVPPYSLKREAQ